MSNHVHVVRRKMAVTTAGSSRQAMTLIGPSHRGHTITSTANTRFNKAAQSSRYVDRGAPAFGVDADDVANDEGGFSITGDDGTTVARSRLVGAKTP